MLRLPVTMPKRCIAIFLLISLLAGVPVQNARAQDFTDQGLEHLILELSEPSGYFDTDNLVSNEISYLQVLPRLKNIAESGQAYLGVGPDQNFTYLVHLRPSLAIIVDVRRDNLLEHLYLKELVEASQDRWEYLSYLFGKRLPLDSARDHSADAETLARHLRSFPSDSQFFEDSFSTIWSSVRRRFPVLTKDDDDAIVYRASRAFFDDNLNLRYRSHGRRARRHYPTYEELMTAKNQASPMGHFLNNEDDFQYLKAMQSKNRIVPIVGDLAGPKALRAIGSHLKKRGYVVSAFYVSNVEFYLFRRGKFQDFANNVRSLPTNHRSLFIRSYFNYWREHPETISGSYVTSLLQHIESFLRLHRENPYQGYWDVVSRDYLKSPDP